ncbi:hypothetical protein WJX81_004864 [Elliptochloris bilobata]|uniref:Uncharacterized protein n=1 Tax=Elliptochloris bilobata TaxID=381761 RepID=A0AAW1SJ72_9CHLO
MANLLARILSTILSLLGPLSAFAESYFEGVAFVCTAVAGWASLPARIAAWYVKVTITFSCVVERCTLRTLDAAYRMLVPATLRDIVTGVHTRCASTADVVLGAGTAQVDKYSKSWERGAKRAQKHLGKLPALPPSSIYVTPITSPSKFPGISPSASPSKGPAAAISITAYAPAVGAT